MRSTNFNLLVLGVKPALRLVVFVSHLRIQADYFGESSHLIWEINAWARSSETHRPRSECVISCHPEYLTKVQAEDGTSATEIEKNLIIFLATERGWMTRQKCNKSKRGINVLFFLLVYFCGGRVLP